MWASRQKPSALQRSNLLKQSQQASAASVSTKSTTRRRGRGKAKAKANDKGKGKGKGKNTARGKSKGKGKGKGKGANGAAAGTDTRTLGEALASPAKKAQGAKRKRKRSRSASGSASTAAAATTTTGVATGGDAGSDEETEGRTGTAVAVTAAMAAVSRFQAQAQAQAQAQPRGKKKKQRATKTKTKTKTKARAPSSSASMGLMSSSGGETLVRAYPHNTEVWSKITPRKRPSHHGKALGSRKVLTEAQKLSSQRKVAARRNKSSLERATQSMLAKHLEDAAVWSARESPEYVVNGVRGLVSADTPVVTLELLEQQLSNTVHAQVLAYLQTVPLVWLDPALHACRVELACKRGEESLVVDMLMCGFGDIHTGNAVLRAGLMGAVAGKKVDCLRLLLFHVFGSRLYKKERKQPTTARKGASKGATKGATKGASKGASKGAKAGGGAGGGAGADTGTQAPLPQTEWTRDDTIALLKPVAMAACLAGWEEGVRCMLSTSQTVMFSCASSYHSSAWVSLWGDIEDEVAISETIRRIIFTFKCVCFTSHSIMAWSQGLLKEGAQSLRSLQPVEDEL